METRLVSAKNKLGGVASLSIEERRRCRWRGLSVALWVGGQGFHK